ncbi:NUDIX domain-containing protein [Candidatus Pacearchaeota archaeon]|nr:NUDIX domain-containing protein [Candidatus Pacearchaeota archaeon]
MEKVPRVGVGVFLVKDNKILLLKRKGAHGEGSWSLAGGHLEFNESWEEAAIREVFEETGVTITNPQFVTATNDIFPVEGKHYITLFMKAEIGNQEPINKEPEKCDKLEWFTWDSLPRPLFVPVENLVKRNFKLFNQ